MGAPDSETVFVDGREAELGKEDRLGDRDDRDG
jgi:hypothetical protein